MLSLPVEIDNLMWKSIFKNGYGNSFHAPLQSDLATPPIKKWWLYSFFQVFLHD